MSTVQVIRGHQFPNAVWFKKEYIEETLDYVPHDGDIIIASFPKTGTTWLSYIVLQIISKGEMFPSFADSLTKCTPCLKVTGTKILETMENPRIYKHHCPYNAVQMNDKAKCLYIYRKPEDTIISYYHFNFNFWQEPPTLDEYFEDFLSGNIGYGHYFDHVLSFFSHKDDENMLLISYEKLQRNRKEEVLKIAKFLGEEYFQSLSEDDSLLEKILEHTSFEYMKENLSVAHPDSKYDAEGKKVNFFRKGAIGDGKKSLSSEQLKRLKDMIIERLEGSTLIEEWLEE